MSDLLERILLLLIGGGVGFILGFMTRSQMRIEKGLHHVEEIVEGRTRDEDGFMEMRYIKDVLYLLVLAITLVGVWRAESALNKAEENIIIAFDERCVAGQDSRDVQRALVDAIYKQFTDILPDPDSPRNDRLTDREVRLTNNYIDNANHFRRSLYRQIVPSEICVDVEGVTDDNVRPKPIDGLPWPYPRVSN